MPGQTSTGSQVKDYQVHYKIEVDASEGTKEVENFAKAVAQLVSAKTNFSTAITNIKDFMKQIDKAFLTKDGKPKKRIYNLSIDTSGSESKLDEVKKKIEEINQLATGLNQKGKKILGTDLNLNTQKTTDKLIRIQELLDEIKKAREE